MHSVTYSYIFILFSCLTLGAMDTSTRSLAFKNDTAYPLTVAHTYVPQGKTVTISAPTQASFIVKRADLIVADSSFECFLFKHQLNNYNRTAPIALSQVLSVVTQKKLDAKNGTLLFIQKQ